MKSIYIYGAGGHGLVVADIARDNGYQNIVFIDDGENQFQSFEDIKRNNSIPIALGIGSNRVRKKLFYKLKECDFSVATLIHHSAVISSLTKIDEGTVVMPQVVVNSTSEIGKGVILNTSCIVEHENVIGNFSHISPGVNLGGDVKIGELTHVGIGCSIIQGVSIDENCIIGAGSVVVKNINKNTKAYGNPSKAAGEIGE